MRGKVRFLYDNVGTDSATLSSDNAVAGWPVDNLKTEFRSQVWKTTASSRVDLNIDYQEGVVVNSIALIENNLVSNSKIIVTAYEDQERLVQLYSREFDLYGSVFGFGELGFGDGGFGGVPDEKIIDLYPRVTHSFFWNDTLESQYYTISFLNNDQAFYLGRLFLCSYFEPQNNFSRGWGYEYVDETRVSKSIGGTKFRDIQPLYYRVTLDLNYLTEEEAFGEFLRILKHIGIRRDMVLSMFPDNPNLHNYTCIYGSFQNMPKLVDQKNMLNRYATKIVFEESL